MRYTVRIELTNNVLLAMFANRYTNWEEEK